MLTSNKTVVIVMTRVTYNDVKPRYYVGRKEENWKHSVRL